MLVDAAGRLAGLFTDSDLARLFERRNNAALDAPIDEVMAKSPTTVQAGDRMEVALAILTERKFSELPVVDQQGRPVGMIDVTDVVGMLPEQARENWHRPFTGGEFELPAVRLFAGEEEATSDEFCWPFAQLPETD
jgi:Mg/Co/Ni transporter MgtE